MTLTYIAIGFVAIFAVAKILLIFKVSRLRRNGIYPERGKATDDDIIRLLQSGHQSLAMRCHREIYHLSLSETKQAVHKLGM